MARTRRELHPFGRSTISTIWGDLAVLAPTDRYELRAYESGGALVRIIRRDHELRSPTQAELDRLLADSFADLPEVLRVRFAAQTADMPLVEFFPAFEALHSDPLGHLWVQYVFEIGEDYFLGRATDEFDVERVQLWHLHRTGG